MRALLLLITVVSNWIAREEITIIEVGKNAKDTNFFYKLNRDEITINEAGKMLKIPTFLPKKKKLQMANMISDYCLIGK